MTWSFEQQAHKIYNQNPLVSTDVELRFHPVLKVTQENNVNGFQDLVRERFPKFREGRVRAVSVNGSSMEIQDKQQFQFGNKGSDLTVYLSQDSIRVGSSAHHNRELLIDNFLYAQSALESLFGEINYLRVGVRYVNIIDIQKISDALNLELEWPDLVQDTFLQVPANLADNKYMNFNSSYTSNLENKDGFLTLQYALIQGNKEIPDHFRFDIDRFVELNGTINDLQEMLLEYTIDIYSLFETVVGSRLKQWMNQE